MVTNKTASGSAWVGWIIFAGAMLLMVGTFNIIEGIIALVDDTRVVVAADRLIAVDLTGWGWTLLIFGIVMFATGLGLFTGQAWARVTAIVIVGLHAVSQVAWLAAYPLWSLLMMALDTVVLYALTARWTATRDDLGPYGPAQQTRVG
jgi:hypothetical protein